MVCNIRIPVCIKRFSIWKQIKKYAGKRQFSFCLYKHTKREMHLGIWTAVQSDPSNLSAKRLKVTKSSFLRVMNINIIFMYA